MTELVNSAVGAENGQVRQSLSTAAARNLATTTQIRAADAEHHPAMVAGHGQAMRDLQPTSPTPRAAGELGALARLATHHA